MIHPSDKQAGSNFKSHSSIMVFRLDRENRKKTYLSNNLLFTGCMLKTATIQ